MPHRFAKLLTFVVLIVASAVAQAAIPVYGYKVVKAYPHDTSAFTEGLFYKDGYLYESTGEAGESTVRKVELASGRVLQRHDVPAQYFGEGIVDWKDSLVQLTWRSQTGFVYDLDGFTPRATFRYPGEGWALTRDDQRLYMSDGSSVLRVLDPDSLKQVASIKVTANGRPVDNLNELEWVKGRIYANIWLTDRIAIIDPGNGHVVGWIDLDGLLDAGPLNDPGNDVLNGIAYDAAQDRLFVTGKRWPRLYQIQLVPRP